jgi:hypothetical protein
MYLLYSYMCLYYFTRKGTDSLSFLGECDLPLFPVLEERDPSEHLDIKIYIYPKFYVLSLARSGLPFGGTSEKQ